MFDCTNDLLMRAEVAERSCTTMARTASKLYTELEECIKENKQLKARVEVLEYAQNTQYAKAFAAESLLTRVLKEKDQ